MLLFLRLSLSINTLCDFSRSVHIFSVTIKCPISTLMTTIDRHKHVSSYEVKNMFGLFWTFLNDKQFCVFFFKIKLFAFHIYIFITL